MEIVQICSLVQTTKQILFKYETFAINKQQGNNILQQKLVLIKLPVTVS